MMKDILDVFAEALRDVLRLYVSVMLAPFAVIWALANGADIRDLFRCHPRTRG